MNYTKLGNEKEREREALGGHASQPSLAHQIHRKTACFHMEIATKPGGLRSYLMVTRCCTVLHADPAATAIDVREPKFGGQVLWQGSQNLETIPPHVYPILSHCVPIILLLNPRCLLKSQWFRFKITRSQTCPWDLSKLGPTNLLIKFTG